VPSRSTHVTIINTVVSCRIPDGLSDTVTEYAAPRLTNDSIVFRKLRDSASTYMAGVRTAVPPDEATDCSSAQKYTSHCLYDLTAWLFSHELVRLRPNSRLSLCYCYQFCRLFCVYPAENAVYKYNTRRHSTERIHPPRHTEIGTVSLPACHHHFHFSQQSTTNGRPPGDRYVSPRLIAIPTDHEHTVMCGVPQKSVLGSFLSVLHAADVATIANIGLHATTVVCTCPMATRNST